MAQQNHRLLEFLHNSLANGKYPNLIFENSSDQTFSIALPPISRELTAADEGLIKDWYALNGKKYEFGQHDTNVKQAMEASLRKSVYVEKVADNGTKSTYRFLNEAEVNEKKRLREGGNTSTDNLEEMEVARNVDGGN